MAKNENWLPIEQAPIWVEVIVYQKESFKRKSGWKVFTAVQTAPGKWWVDGSKGKFSRTPGGDRILTPPPSNFQYLPEFEE